MDVVKVQYAKTHLSALLTRVEQGHEVMIARGSTPIAKLVPLEMPAERELGFVAYSVPSGFDDPLPEDELGAWEGAA